MMTPPRTILTVAGDAESLEEGVRVLRERGLDVEVGNSQAERTARVLQQMSAAIFMLDPDLTFAYVSDAAAQILGRSRKDVLGDRVQDVLPDMDASVFQEVQDSQEPVTMRLHQKTAAQWLEMSLYPVPTGVIVHMRDVTAEQADEQQLRLHQAALEAAANSIVITNRDGIIEWVNPAYALNYGYDEAELIGRRPGELTGSGRQSKAVYKDLWDTIVSGKIWAGEIVNRRKDGSLITEELTITPVRDQSGAISHFVGIQQDISERKRVEHRLSQQAALLEHASDAILVRDPDHIITYWNASATTLYGWSRDEAIGQSIEKLLYEDPSAFRGATQAVLKDGEWSGLLDQVTRDGKHIVVHGRWTLMRDENDRPSSILAVNTDVTRQRELEQRSLRMQRVESIGTLAGGIAHDLNNMLTPVLMGVEILANGEEDEARREVIDSMRRSVESGASLVRQVLSFARGLDGEHTEVHLGSLMRDVRALLVTGAREKIVLEVDVADDLRTVDGDTTQLHQAVINLAVNGMDAMPEGGTLRISLQNKDVDPQFASSCDDLEAGPYVVVVVEDEGKGIPDAVLERMYEPFFTTKEFGKGTGLGLSTTLGIVQSHGGMLDVTTVVREGTTFSMYLPARTSTGGMDATLLTDEDVVTGDGKLVLVVDDDEAILAITQQTLVHHGYRVLTASNGTEAAGLFARNRSELALVLTDLMMPSMDGPSLVRVIRRMDPGMPVVGCTGYAAESVATEMADLGVRHILKKPFTAHHLISVIQSEVK